MSTIAVTSSQSLTINEEPLFDPNAFGMATLLGGLLIMGIASDLMIDSTTDWLAWSLGYFGLVLIICSLIAFTYSFIHCFQVSSNELRPLTVNNNLQQHQHHVHHFHHQFYGSSSSLSSSSSLIKQTNKKVKNSNSNGHSKSDTIVV
ncbi:uncharacterized protein LOC113799669 [Dermatophagoides pteronyssinus]|uniref:Uncharacterized protein LOC113799669 n=2 Tax=Dermatophagoides pteronyssinus TaxID=6956 RepID=A0A6P6YLT1_DERPT|nr:uncharacterized protein LOC113799669 [Dermatophagoides pteronyssinus]KAH9420627.1 hypothetical protein DERP_001055 [Dermatophagoides pteronyssinus]